MRFQFIVWTETTATGHHVMHFNVSGLGCWMWGYVPGTVYERRVPWMFRWRDGGIGNLRWLRS